jgi:hypothetical protein
MGKEALAPQRQDTHHGYNRNVAGFFHIVYLPKVGFSVYLMD